MTPAQQENERQNRTLFWGGLGALTLVAVVILGTRNPDDAERARETKEATRACADNAIAHSYHSGSPPSDGDIDNIVIDCHNAYN